MDLDFLDFADDDIIANESGYCPNCGAPVNNEEKWIPKDLKKDSFRKLAAKHGGLKEDGTIKQSFIDRVLASDKFTPLQKKRASLARTFKKITKRRFA